jgi:hypothetical protein
MFDLHSQGEHGLEHDRAERRLNHAIKQGSRRVPPGSVGSHQTTPGRGCKQNI